MFISFDFNFDEKNKIDGLFTKWVKKNPNYWSKIDLFCWLFDWSIRKNIEFYQIRNFADKLPNGFKLCELNLDFFINLSGEYGMDLFEEFHILLSSFLPPRKRIKYKIKGCKKNSIKKFKKKITSKILQFLKNILLDPETNPKIIRWKNKSNRIFVFKKPNVVAQMWGKYTGNDKMNYDKFSRSIRYCYRKKFIQHLDENFTFMFGENHLNADI